MNKAIQFLCSDFETAWDAVASQEGNIPRGNLMFAVLIGQMYAVGVVQQRPAGDSTAVSFMEYMEHIDQGYRGLVFDLFMYLLNPLSVLSEEAAAVGPNKLDVAITGAMYGRQLSRLGSAYAEGHLTVKDGKLRIRTEQLYLDTKKALAMLDAK